MGIDRLLKNDGLKEQERVLLETVKAIVENPQRNTAKMPEFEKLQEKNAAVSARQKLFLEIAAGRGENSFSGQVGKHLFVKGDAGLQDRILSAGKSLGECGRYIMKQAENMAKEGKREVLCVSDDVVYGWAEEYFRSENIRESDLILQFPAAQGSGSGVRKKGDTAPVRPAAGKKKTEKRKTAPGQNAGTGKGMDRAEKREETAADQSAAGTGKKTDGENRQLSLFDICPG